MPKNAINTVKERGSLKPRHEPYWSRLGIGCHLGFRKMAATSTGTWIAKYRNPDTGVRDKRSLGGFENLPPSQRFDAAKKAAEEWFSHLGRGGSAEPMTIRDVCARYVEHLRATMPKTTLSAYALRRRPPGTPEVTVPAADDAESRFRRYVLDDPKFAATEVAKLTPVQVDAWRKRLAVRPTAAGGNRNQRRTASTLNRDMTCFRAALNLAFKEGLITSDFAWRQKLEPVKAADRRRELYLDKDQRRGFIEHARLDLAMFLRALSLVPLRPGALAAMKADSFDRRLGVLKVGKDKAGHDRNIKLPPATAAFFEAATTGKLPSAPLLAQADGRAWNKDAWKGPVQAAAQAAGLPAGATTYTLRHSTISDLVHGGLDLLTVAQISGTSVRMIEKHYGHLRGAVAEAALSMLAL